jgi:hypothetical protein
MGWSEQQRVAAKRELRRRLSFETAATYRRSFLKAAAQSAGCLLVGILGLSMYRHGPDWVIRIQGLFALCLGGAGLLVTAALSYVRHLDWRRRREVEG